MTKYCPICSCEYRNSVKICPDDNGVLTSQHPIENLDSITVDIYAAANEIEAERIVTILMQEEVEASHRQSDISQLPTTTNSHFLITVPTAHKQNALRLLTHARHDGIITTLGVFL